MTQRAGQVAFNILELVRPDIADKIRGTVADPFYNDDKLTVFYYKVIELLRE